MLGVCKRRATQPGGMHRAAKVTTPFRPGFYGIALFTVFRTARLRDVVFRQESCGTPSGARSGSSTEGSAAEVDAVTTGALGAPVVSYSPGA
jgi:hypothetical protein